MAENPTDEASVKAIAQLALNAAAVAAKAASAMIDTTAREVQKYDTSTKVGEALSASLKAADEALSLAKRAERVLKPPPGKG